MQYEWLRMKDDCIRMEDEWLRMKDDCIRMEHEWLRMKDDCIRMEYDCIRMKNDWVRMKIRLAMNGHDCLPMKDDCLSIKHRIFYFDLNKYLLYFSFSPFEQPPKAFARYNLIIGSDILIDVLHGFINIICQQYEVHVFG